MNILIVEDDQFLSEKIKETFEKKILSNRVEIVNSFSSFLNKLNILKSYDIFLIDIFLGKNEIKNGIDILKLIRKKQLNIPIVIISGFSSIDRLTIAFDNGANDYIIKPFRLKELELRINKWYKSFFIGMNYSNKTFLEYNGLIYDLQKNEFSYAGETIFLSKKSKYLLSIFIGNREILLSEDFLISKIWGDILNIHNRNLRVNILRLKRSLESFGIDKWIKNIRGEGYIFICKNN